MRTESALVAVARLESGLAAAEDTAAVAAPRGGLLRAARRWLGFFPFFRAFIAMEMTLLALLAAIVDAIRATRGDAPARDRAGPDRGDHRRRAPAAIVTSQRLR